MDLKRLKYFCTVVESGNISKAAQQLYMSQPPLSKRLHELEEELGTALLKRENGKIEPTPTGWFLYNRAAEILRHIGNLERETQRFAAGEKRKLRIGITHLLQRCFRPFLAKLINHYPMIEFSVVVSDSSHLEAQLRGGHLDFACIQRPDSIEDVDMITLSPVRAVVVAHEQLLAAQQSDTIHLHDLGQFPLVLLRRINGRGTFEFLLDKLRKNGIEPNVMMNITQPQVILDLLENGVVAATLLPETEVVAAELKHCRIFHLAPEILMFFPTLLKLSTAPDVPEIIAVVEEGF